MKLQKAVVTETRNTALFTGVGAVIVLIVFLILQKLDLAVFLGALLGYAGAVGNFFAMAYTVQLAADNIHGDTEEDVKRGKRVMKISYTWRRMAQAAVIVISIIVPFINWIPTVIIMVLPGLMVIVRQAMKSIQSSKERTDKPNG